jgi:hypothetical protein
MIARSSRLALALVFVLASLSRADEVLTKEGKKLEGRITHESDQSITILTYKDGEVTLDADKVKSTKKKPNLYDDFDKQREGVEDAEGHFKLAEWCKSKGLLWRATMEYELTIGFDREHEKAHKALGHEKIDGEWKTHDEVMAAKGFTLVNGKWVETKKVEAKKAANRVGWVLTGGPSGIEVDRAFLEEWSKTVISGSKFMWMVSQGQLYVKEFTLYVKPPGKACDYSIVNKDSNKLANGAYGETDGGTIHSPAKMQGYTFLHELIHYKYSRPHCDTCQKCVMSNSPDAKTEPTICDDGDHTAPPATSCWSAIRAYHQQKDGIELRPLVRTKPEPELPPVPETKDE